MVKSWAVLGTIFGVILVIVGIFTATRKIDRTEKLAQIVKIDGDNKNCPMISNKPNIGPMFSCIVSIKIEDRTDLLDVKYTGNESLFVGRKIPVYVKNDNSNDVVFEQPTPKFVGYVMIGGGILITLIAWVWVWLAGKYKFIAFATGARGALDIVGGGKW